MNRFYFWYYRKRYGIPCREEIRIAAHGAGGMFREISDLYTRHGYSIEEIATRTNRTRERVRQILWKQWRRHNSVVY